MRPSEEKRTSFWVRERRIRSLVAGQVMVFVRGWEESQPDLGGKLVLFVTKDIEKKGGKAR